VRVWSPRSEDEEEDRYHCPRWCPDGLTRSQKRRVQRLRSLEEAEARYIETLKKARPDLAEQVHYVQEKESRASRREWRPSREKPIRRYRLVHTWFLYFLQNSMLRPTQNHQ
jgi:hypothetical protein